MFDLVYFSQFVIKLIDEKHTDRGLGFIGDYQIFTLIMRKSGESCDKA